jgi:hypothetical protein
LAAEETEPNDAFADATPIPLDSEVRAYLVEGHDVDIFRFETGDGYRNVLDITLENAGSFAPDVTLYDHLRERVENEYSITPGAGVVLQLSARPSSTYFVHIRDLDGFAGRSGDYTLAIRNR